MKRVGFAYNPTYPTALELRDRGLAWSAAHGIEAWTEPAIDTAALVASLPGSDALVVLGGDGTFLRAARAVAEVDVPILGINGGRVGFLSKAESDQLEDVLGQIEAGEFELEARMVLEARILPGPAAGREIEGDPHVALNEVAVVRGATARVVRLDLAVDDAHVATYIADGIVVASPTGSTGYSSSAGGPILDPTARNLVVTPIAAYMALLRSIVVGPHHSVTVRVIDAADCLVSIDGRDEAPLHIGDAVRVQAGDRQIRFIEPSRGTPFWQLLRRKAELLPH